MAYDDKHFELASKEIERHLEDSRINRIAHYELADAYEAKNHRLNVVHGISIGIIITWLLSSQFKESLPEHYQTFFGEVLPIILSMVVAVLSSLGPLLKYGEKAIKNKSAAQKYHALWRNCLNWETDYPDKSMVKEAVQAARNYRELINEINRESPSIPDWAWDKVEKVEKKGGTEYDVDEKEKKKNS